MIESGWVYGEAIPKLYTGDIDYAIGLNDTNAEMIMFQIYKYVE